MLLNGSALDGLFSRPLDAGVYYFYASEEYPVRAGAAGALRALREQASDTEVTRIDGPAPDIEEAIAAAGMISLFGTKRVVELSMVEPSAMTEADVSALCGLMDSLENAVIVMTTVFRDDKAMKTKKAQKLIAAADKAGAAVGYEKLNAQALKRFAQQCAAQEGARLSSAAAQELIERCGVNQFTIENEIKKLAAACGYGEITPQLVGSAASRNLEADVFDMVRLASAGRSGRAMEKLIQLLTLGHEPIGITAALAGNYVDMYRAKRGGQTGRGTMAIHKDFGGSEKDRKEYRVRKAGEAASRYTNAQLEEILNVLLELDMSLKSSSVEKDVLLQTAMCEILTIGARQ